MMQWLCKFILDASVILLDQMLQTSNEKCIKTSPLDLPNYSRQVKTKNVKYWR